MNTKTIQLSRIKNSILDEKLVQDQVVIERVITIQVDDVSNYAILCTPSDVKALVVGFLFAEGIIEDFSDIIDIADYNSVSKVIAVKVEAPAQTASKRNLLVTSSCGLCGTRNIENLLNVIPACDTTLYFAVAELNSLVEKLHAKQIIFQQTGGAHAAGIFNSAGEIITFSEDIGRHNALDKAIGGCLLQNYDAHGCGVVLSSRVSFEMVAKAARAGIEMIVAVSAPSSLAIEAAEKWNITLCGFARGENANVYTGLHRLI
ncbi:MAG: formate dehydrogenase accessory sulfurtransferase FdhD [Gammaproteobacteria bacterium]|jgi:FdhD protein